MRGFFASLRMTPYEKKAVARCHGLPSSSIRAYREKLTRHLLEFYFSFVLFDLREVYTDWGLDIIAR